MHLGAMLLKVYTMLAIPLNDFKKKNLSFSTVYTNVIWIRHRLVTSDVFPFLAQAQIGKTMF